jgi:hypothetical protein
MRTNGKLDALLHHSDQGCQHRAAPLRHRPPHTSVGDYVGALCQALAVAVLEPSGLCCEATIGDGFLDSERCKRLSLIIAGTRGYCSTFRK